MNILDPSISLIDLADSMENWARNEKVCSVISLQFNEQIMWCPQGTDSNVISPTQHRHQKVTQCSKSQNLESITICHILAKPWYYDFKFATN